MQEYEWLFLMTWILLILGFVYVATAVTRKPPSGGGAA